MYNNIQEKYGYDEIVSKDAYEIELLKVNDENLDDYEVDGDGIGNWEKYEEFAESEYDENSNFKQLTDVDYKTIIEESDSQAYHQTFDIEEI